MYVHTVPYRVEKYSVLATIRFSSTATATTVLELTELMELIVCTVKSKYKYINPEACTETANMPPPPTGILGKYHPHITIGVRRSTSLRRGFGLCLAVNDQRGLGTSMVGGYKYIYKYILSFIYAPTGDTLSIFFVIHYDSTRSHSYALLSATHHVLCNAGIYALCKMHLKPNSQIPAHYD